MPSISNCSKRRATSGPHGALRSHCCTADKRLSTTTRNARTSSASSVRSSSTRSDASGTTSRRRYTSPAPGCSLHDRIPDPSYRISSRLLSTRSGSCWRPYDSRYRRWTFCLSLYWWSARQSSRWPWPHSPICHCTLQVTAGAPTAEQGGARQIISSQLQADI